MRTKSFALACAALLAVAGPALAHITLAAEQAKVGSSYRAVLRVPHGCDGAATTAIRVQIPEGMIGVKPMPHAGWELATKTETYPTPVKYYEDTLTEGVTEIDWTGGKLADAWYDEFVFTGKLPDKGAETTLYFPTVQECEGGKVVRWIEIPAAGKSDDDYENPAPGLKLTK